MPLKRIAVVGFLALASVTIGPAQGASPLGQYIVVLKPGADRSAAIASARGMGGDVLMRHRIYLRADLWARLGVIDTYRC